MASKALGIIVALLAGVGLGFAASGAFQDILATIRAEVVESTGAGDGASLQGSISLDAGRLEAGKHYVFDDVDGETYLYTGNGGNFTFTLVYNNTVFQFVKVKIELSDGYDAEFYLDTNNPSQTLALPGSTSIEVEVELEEITVSANATTGTYEIQVHISSP
jgi:uncharacterized membrane protein